MKFQIAGAGWQLGDALCPAGTVIDFDKPDQWTRLAKGKVPFDAVRTSVAGATGNLRGASAFVARRLAVRCEV